MKLDSGTYIILNFQLCAIKKDQKLSYNNAQENTSASETKVYNSIIQTIN